MCPTPDLLQVRPSQAPHAPAATRSVPLSGTAAAGGAAAAAAGDAAGGEGGGAAAAATGAEAQARLPSAMEVLTIDKYQVLCAVWVGRNRIHTP